MAKNKNLHKAKTAKNDEFYTQLTDIEKELSHYRAHFKDKIILCNCDDPTRSEFWRYFHLNFEFFGLKKLISTHYSATERTYKLEYTGGNDTNIEDGIKTDLLQNGDFRSDECIELLKQADIVVTNPPFSLFREYIAQLIDHDKKFICIGNKNAITYKEFFPLLKDNEVWIGYNNPIEFSTPDGITTKLNGLTRWFTNLDISKRHEFLDLIEKYSPEKYPKYDNYDAINVDRVADIPVDYDGVMGVPITFLDKFCPEQFEILGITCRGYSPEYRIKLYDSDTYERANDLNGSGCILVNNKPKMLYGRILIRKKAGNNYLKTEIKEYLQKHNGLNELAEYTLDNLWLLDMIVDNMNSSIIVIAETKEQAKELIRAKMELEPDVDIEKWFENNGIKYLLQKAKDVNDVWNEKFPNILSIT